MEPRDKGNNVGQPPSAVHMPDQQARPAKPAKAEYRRHLPHLQVEDKPLFVTFATFKRWVLPEPIRQVVLRHCLHDHGVKLQVHGIVVMPDHVHIIFTPLKDDEGNPFGLAEIMSGIKGASAHSVNKPSSDGEGSGRTYPLTTYCVQTKAPTARFSIFARIRCVKGWREQKMNIRGYGESGWRAPKIWRNLSMPGINKAGQPGAAVLHARPSQPAPLSRGFYRL
jgi:REP element-mobilizing transposase RayT